MGANLDQTTVYDSLKETYAKKLEDYRPGFAILQDLLKGSNKGSDGGDLEIGKHINIPVLLTQQTSETYGLAANTDTIRAPVAMYIQDAVSDQFETTLPVRIPFGLISKVDEQGTKARFASKADLLMFAGKKGSLRINELVLLHGGNSRGKVSVNAGVTGPVGGVYSAIISLTAGSWSDGIWAASEGSPLDAYTLLSGGAKRNASGDLLISLVDPVAKALTLTSTVSTDLSTIAANDFLFPAGAYGKELTGLMNIIGTTTGTQFGISSSNYSMWKPKQVTVTGPITIGKLISGVAPAVSYGADGELEVLVSPRNWADLNKDAASARRYDYSYNKTKATNGVKALEVESANVDLKIVLHPFMKDGEIAAFPKANFFRCGSHPDPSMEVGGEMLKVMSSVSNAFEYRFWVAQTLVPNLLATSTLFSGITPNAN